MALGYGVRERQVGRLAPRFLAHTAGRMVVPLTELRYSDAEPDFGSVSGMLDLRWLCYVLPAG